MVIRVIRVSGTETWGRSSFEMRVFSKADRTGYCALGLGNLRGPYINISYIYIYRERESNTRL